MAAMEEQGMSKKYDIGFVVSQDLVPAISIPAVKLNGVRQPHMYRSSSYHQRALSSYKLNLKSKHSTGKLTTRAAYEGSSYSEVSFFSYVQTWFLHCGTCMLQNVLKYAFYDFGRSKWEPPHA